MTLLNQIRYTLWGPFTVLLILFTGIYLTFSSSFVQFWCFPKLLKLKNNTSKNGISPFEALCTSLGGTLGVGNLAGVAIAIQLGGAGAVFFMLVAAFFGMATKYSELLLAVHYQTKDKSPIGGPMVYLSKGADLPLLAKIFAIFCVISAVGTGAAAQGSAIAEAVNNVLPISKIFIGIITGILLLPILYGGSERIAKVSAIIVPFMTVCYLTAGVIVLIIHKNEIPNAILKIFYGVTEPLAAGGGLIGFITSRAISDGFAKGVFSNEAGMGSAPIAHGCTVGAKPCQEGMLGAIEVFIDTFVVCLMTSLVILVTGADNSGLYGLSMTSFAFSSLFGNIANEFISITVVFLAVSTVLGWSFYGLTCLKWLNIKNISFYPVLIAISVALASHFPLIDLLILCDIASALMALPNLYGLWILAPVVNKQTKLFLGIKKHTD